MQSLKYKWEWRMASRNAVSKIKNKIWIAKISNLMQRGTNVRRRGRKDDIKRKKCNQNKFHSLILKCKFFACYIASLANFLPYDLIFKHLLNSCNGSEWTLRYQWNEKKKKNFLMNFLPCVLRHENILVLARKNISMKIWNGGWTVCEYACLYTLRYWNLLNVYGSISSISSSIMLSEKTLYPEMENMKMKIMDGEVKLE